MGGHPLDQLVNPRSSFDVCQIVLLPVKIFDFIFFTQLGIKLAHSHNAPVDGSVVTPKNGLYRVGRPISLTSNLGVSPLKEVKQYAINVKIDEFDSGLGRPFRLSRDSSLGF